MSQLLTEKLTGVSCGRILDVATGRGEFLLQITQASGNYTEAVGIDCEERIVKAAQEFMADQELANATFLTMDGSALAFQDNSFDTVAISNSLHHLANLEGTLDEMYRVLKPGGLFICQEMFCDGQSPRQQMHVDFHHWWGDIDQVLGITHNHTFARERITAELTRLQFLQAETLDTTRGADEEQSREELQNLADLNDRVIERIRDKDAFRPLKARGEELKQRLFETGWALATQVLFLGRK
ncbi:MAG: class I SAM-dependent methyltransferase [bacterium]|nr:class I SAM-dependent methyltransferase [bacterium]